MQETIGGGGNIITKGFPTAWGLVAKPCDYCNSAAALLFCRTDSAFMCMACESKVHSTTTKYKHERVWMCEVCEQAPASVTCKADAASLCVTCDRDIHSANPLSRRHERIPVVPFYDTAELVVKSPAAAASTFLVPPPVSSSTRIAQEICLIDPTVSNKAPHADAPDLKSMEFPFAADSDNYLDFDYPMSTETQHYSCGTDGVVPVQVQTFKTRVSTQLPVHSSFQKHFEIDFTKSHISSYNNSYTTPQSLSHSVSSSSLDVGVVPDPDGSCMTDISYQFGQSMSSSDTVDLTGSTVRNQASQMILGLNREARVLRYREKRKNRKFEKTIRYASRKAYAETRPRIKGRFAKRTNNDQPQSDHHIMDGMFGLRTPDFATDFISESKFGVVPSF